MTAATTPPPAPSPESPSPEPPRHMRESCGTLRDYWYVACTSDELGAAKPLGRTILEENLVLYRGEDHQPICFVDRCLHRNAQLSEGFTKGGCLVCPYHGWTFDRSGSCVRIPTEGPEPRRHPKKQLAAFPVREQEGLVWVYMGDSARSGEREPYRMPRCGEAGWTTYYMVTPFDGDVTDCAENFMDVPHTVTVHAGWFRSEVKKKVEAVVERTEDSVLVTYHLEDDAIGFTKYLLNPSGEPTVHTDNFYMPNVTRVDYSWAGKRAFIICSQCTPVSPLKTMVYTAITFRLGLGGLFDRVMLPALRWYTRQVIQQDVDIMANQTRSVRRYGKSFMNAEADLHHVFIESLRDWARGGEQGPRPKPVTAAMTFYV